jgi:hypothetical protein
MESKPGDRIRQPSPGSVDGGFTHRSPLSVCVTQTELLLFLSMKGQSGKEIFHAP